MTTETPTVQFSDFNLSTEILAALKRMKYTHPSPVQAQAIPLIQENHDLIALAETGSGKTAACAIPICDRVDIDRRVIQALILVPTRELALQYATEVAKVGAVKGIHTLSVLGGEGYDLQRAKIKHGVQVCVATPGRLIDFIYSREIDLSHVETLILDEADEMLSMGFLEDLEFIMDCLIHEHQTLLFSATMPPVIKKIAKARMKDPQEVLLINEKAAPKLLDHSFVYEAPPRRLDRLGQLIQEMRPNQSIIFVESRIDCEKVCRGLRNGVQAVDFLHGGLPQEIRNAVTGKFRSGKICHLVATDVAARGLDFSGVTHVFLYQLPRDPEVYVHRSGRTGRYGKKGHAISFVGPRDLDLLNRVLDQIDKDAIWIGPSPTPRSARGHKKKPPPPHHKRKGPGKKKPGPRRPAP